MKQISVKLKITLWYTVAMVIVSAVALLFMAQTTNMILMRDEMGILIKTVNDSTRRIMMQREDAVPPHELRQPDGIHILVYDNDYKLIHGELPESYADSGVFKNDHTEKAVGSDNVKYNVYIREIKIPGYGSVWIKGVKDTTGAAAVLKSIIRNNLLIYIAVILAAACGGFILTKKALKPVDKISNAARKISESNNLSQRIALGKGNDEIYTLANTFDDMLEQLETAFEKEKQFTSDASHELRTPVSVIMSECDYSQSCELSTEEYKEVIEVVSRQAGRMSSLISQLLTISRMDKNTQKLNFEKFDISELFEIVCEDQKEINDESISLICDIEKNVMVRGDKSLMARLMINLLSNAYKYGRPGGFVKAELKKETDTLIIKISDNGIGIREEDIDKIWDRFYRGDTSRSDDSGTGLGLSMVKWIAKVHGAKITVSSKENEGAVFTFIMKDI